MTELILMRGLPSSGKTTAAMALLSERPSMIRISLEDLRAQQGGYCATKEAIVIAQQEQLIRQAAAEGLDIVCDDTNLVPATVTRLTRLANELGIDLIHDCSCLNVPIQVCVERDSAKQSPVGLDSILRMHLSYLAEPVTTNELLSSCVIVDIDGTIAHASGRSVLDFSKVYSDSPDEPVLSLVWMLATQHKIVLITGRPESCRGYTELWLADFAKLGDFELHMRHKRDYRKDYSVKRELYDAHVKGKYSVHLVLDDRDSTVLLWRSLGLKCLQCSYGNF